ncbi:hypothetical protein [Thermus sediminis]|uniref:hypothetical protein n=1 Tax=Thermus sediminis TaxID=1761908 RepID=UPI0018E56D72|nr:hypothetical protein [Thermus sediminis]
MAHRREVAIGPDRRLRVTLEVERSQVKGWAVQLECPTGPQPHRRPQEGGPAQRPWWGGQGSGKRPGLWAGEAPNPEGFSPIYALFLGGRPLRLLLPGREIGLETSRAA